MLSAGEEILEKFKQQGKFNLSDNKEYWEELYYKKGKIMNAGGDSFSDTEEFRMEISEDDALDKIRRYFINHADINEDLELDSDEEVLDYWNNWP